jgi:hypothetical protein
VVQVASRQIEKSTVCEDFCSYFDEIVDTSSFALQKPEDEGSEIKINEFEIQCAERSNSESPDSVEDLTWDCNAPWPSTAVSDVLGDADENVSESTCETPSTCAGCEDQSWLPIEGCWAEWNAGDSPCFRTACLRNERPPAQCRTGWDNDEAVDELGGRGPATLKAPRVDEEEDPLCADDGESLAPNDTAGAALTACKACPCSPVSLSDACFPCLSWDLCAVE